MPELTDLEVDRLDVVDRPATGLKFCIMKAEDGGAAAAVAPVATPEPVAKAGTAPTPLVHPVGETPPIWGSMAKALVDAFDGAEVTPAQADALAGLAKAANLSITLKALTPEQKEKAKAGENPFAARKDAADLPSPAVEALAKGQAELVSKMGDLVEALNQSRIAKAATPPSTQGREVAVEKAAPRKMGEGLFVDKIFGKA